MAPGATPETRFEELESRLTHQQRLLDELNEVVIEQRALLDGLREELRVLREHVESPPDADPGNEPPPHYLTPD